MKADVQVIRMGLKSSDNIADGKSILGGTFHPAFRQLVESAVAREELERQLLEKSQILNLISVDQATENDLNLTCISEVTFFSKKESLSNMIGNKGSNRIYFQNKYPNITFTFQVDSSLKIGEYIVR
jgi:hypothetical protein